MQLDDSSLKYQQCSYNKNEFTSSNKNVYWIYLRETEKGNSIFTLNHRNYVTIIRWFHSKTNILTRSPENYLDNHQTSNNTDTLN